MIKVLTGNELEKLNEIDIKKEHLNNTLKEVELLMRGKIKALRFFEVSDNDERVLDATNYLDAKNIFYILKDIKDEKYGEGLELKLVEDEEEIDYLYEDLDCMLVLEDVSEEEDKFLNKLDKINTSTYHYFMTKEQIKNIRWELIKYVVGDKFNFDVFYSKGLVRISKFC